MGGLKPGKRLRRRPKLKLYRRANGDYWITPEAWVLSRKINWNDTFDWDAPGDNTPVEVCPQWIHKLSPVRLAPGEGPVKVTIDIRRAE